MFSSCVYHKADLVPDTSTATSSIGCDTDNVSYNTIIKPILRNNCYSCHGTLENNGGLDLEDTTSLKQYLLNDFRGDGIYGSKLLHCMSHSINALPMPPTYVVDSCSLRKVRSWLNKGGPVD